MLLKKQTVWLLTMLSLIIVLSVYYITTPQQTPTDMAYLEEEEKEQPAKEELGGESSEEQSNETASTNQEDELEAQISSISSDELFTELRLDIEDARSQRIEDWEAIITSAEATAEMKSDAKDKMDELRTLAQKESILETLLRKQYNYSDVLVNTMDNKVQIIVKADNLSAKQANQIMQEARDQLGEDKTIAVEYEK